MAAGELLPVAFYDLSVRRYLARIFSVRLTLAPPAALEDTVTWLVLVTVEVRTIVEVVWTEPEELAGYELAEPLAAPDCGLPSVEPGALLPEPDEPAPELAGADEEL